jgi:hypothetical protein
MDAKMNFNVFEKRFDSFQLNVKMLKLKFIFNDELRKWLY